MKANEVRFFEGSSGIIQAVIRGDAAVAHMTDIPLNAMLADGAPMGFIYPKSGTTTSNSIYGVAAKAPHPNVGRVFVNWLMTKEGQAMLRRAGWPLGHAQRRARAVAFAGDGQAAEDRRRHERADSRSAEAADRALAQGVRREVTA